MALPIFKTVVLTAAIVSAPMVPQFSAPPQPADRLVSVSVPNKLQSASKMLGRGWTSENSGNVGVPMPRISVQEGAHAVVRASVDSNRPEATFERLRYLRETSVSWSAELDVPEPSAAIFDRVDSILAQADEPMLGSLRVFPSEEGGLVLQRRTDDKSIMVTIESDGSYAVVYDLTSGVIDEYPVEDDHALAVLDI